jgi:hypothetical protein
MIIKPDGKIRFLTVAEHLQRNEMVYQDAECTVYMHANKNVPFVMREGQGQDIYIDLFALRFGQKEQLQRRTGSGCTPIHYGCPRAKRDMILFLPIEDIIDKQTQRCCLDKSCQYWSPPTGLKGRYVIHCILMRCQAFGLFDHKSLTLEEVGRIYGCTRERVRQIQDRALHRLRHQSRMKQLKIFQERIPDYRDYFTKESGVVE